MKIDLLLVNPSNREQTYGVLSSMLAGIEPPLWCGLTAGFIRSKGYQVDIIDADAENWSAEYTAKKIVERDPLLVDIVVLGTNPSASSTPKMSGVRDLLVALKKIAPDIKTVLSGLHPSALPLRTLVEEKVDFVCQGEGFYTILNLLQLLKERKNRCDYKIAGLWYRDGNDIIPGSYSPILENLDELPFAAWDLLPMDKYRAHNWQCFEDFDNRSPYAVIYTSLGCPFRCRFCPIHAFYGKSCIRYRSPEKVVQEIDLLADKYNVRNIKFMDELFVLKEERVNRICDLIIERGYKLNIWAYARVDTVKKSLLEKMKEAGINWVCYGFESANETVLRGVGKNIHQKKIKETVEITKSAGISIIANFIFGLPDDNLQTLQNNLQMAEEFNFEYVNFYVCLAYPGSKLYTDAVKAGARLPEAWDGYSQYSFRTLPLATKYLKPEEVLRFRDKAFKEYFSNLRYIEMINRKFGSKVVNHIKDMLKKEIARKLYLEDL